MSENRNLVLNSEQILQKIRRIAYEVYEYNFKEKKIIFAGIVGQGFQLAELISKEFKLISDIETEVIKVSIDKSNPNFENVELSESASKLVKYPVVLVDDVLNTGRTLMYSLGPFLEMKVKKLEVAVLVDRGHTRFPVASTYRGIALSTTFNDHIEVKLNGNKSEVCLV